MSEKSEHEEGEIQQGGIVEDFEPIDPRDRSDDNLIERVWRMIREGQPLEKIKQFIQDVRRGFENPKWSEE